MATVSGAMTTTNVLSDQLAIDIGATIYLLEPSANPLTLFVNAADSRRTVATKFSWTEDASKQRFDTTSGTATTTVTTIPVTTGAAYQQWDLVQNTRTGEVFRVDGVTGNNLTVTRNINSSGVGTGVAMNSGDELLIIGTAQPENDTSKAEFNAFRATAFRFGSSRKLALASAVAVGALNKFPASKQQTTNNESTYGMDVTSYTSPFGSLRLVYHRLLEGVKYGGYLILVDMDNVARRYLANDEISRDTKVLPNRQPRDQDGRKDEYLTEDGIEVRLQKTHAVLTGITS
jgi:hypothetical protein